MKTKAKAMSKKKQPPTKKRRLADSDDGDTSGDFVFKETAPTHWSKKRTLNDTTTKMMVLRQSSFGGSFYIGPNVKADPSEKRKSTSKVVSKKTAFDRDHQKADFVAISSQIQDLTQYTQDEQQTLLALAEKSAKNLRLIRNATHKAKPTTRLNNLSPKVIKAAAHVVAKAETRFANGEDGNSYQRRKLKAYASSKDYIFDQALGIRRKRRLTDPKNALVV